MTNAMNTGLYGRVDPGDSFGVTEKFTASDTLTTAEYVKHCTTDGAVVPVTLTAPASPTLN